jgi:hypothetical protein
MVELSLPSACRTSLKKNHHRVPTVYADPQGMKRVVGCGVCRP